MGLGDYPIFDESYRSELNKKIKDTYYFYEIGILPPARFCFQLRAKMNNIMPLYNQYYLSTMKKFDPFINAKRNDSTNEKITKLFEKIMEAVTDTSDDTNGKNDTTNTSSVKTTEKGSNNVDSTSSGNTTTKDTGTEESTVNVEKNNSNTGNDTVSKGGKDNLSSKTQNDGGNTSISIDSDTPEGFIQTQDIRDGTYASRANKSRDSSDLSITKNDTQSYGSTTTTTYNSGNNGIEKQTNDGSHSFKNEVNSSSSANQKGWNHLESLMERTGSNNVTDTINKIINTVQKINENSSETDKLERLFETEGFTGITISEMLQKWRDTFINIDLMIINELRDLFLYV